MPATAPVLIDASAIEGTVKWFDEKKGYGFISHPAGDVFVHYSVIKMHGYRSLHERQAVSYTYDRGSAGLYARVVVPLDPTPSES